MHHAPARAITPTTSASLANGQTPRQQRIEAALRAVANEVAPPAGTRPYSTDSYLPSDITAMLTGALQDIADDANEIERHQLAFNALTTASWHLARGNAPAAIARMRRAATHIKAGVAA